jgi:plasmid stabilization system protein ParE
VTRPLILRPEAEADVEAAYSWYEEREPGLGAEFLRAVEASLSSIERDPELYPKQYKRARRALLRRFPYALFYVVTSDLIEVIGCIHTRRHPRRWRSRL